VNESDAVIFFNFRPDRARQITKAFIYPFFSGFVRPKVVKPYFVAMMDYDRSVFTHVAFPEQEINKPLGEILSEAGKTQLRIAETEKYAHVTFFFSGGTEDKYPGESRILVPSPKVRTYDLKPEMSANEITDKVITELGERSFDVGILNFANSDMVGHSGILEAAVKAVETVDDCLGRVVKTAIDSGYHVMITADHGNSEKLWDYENDSPHTAHTNNPVPFIYVAKEIDRSLKIRSGDKGLSDIAPTILYQLRMPTPRVMEGEPLTRA
jgi:2,3-bisphosphoglycerate-independent phosphoglycerate mutase